MKSTAEKLLLFSNCIVFFPSLWHPSSAMSASNAENISKSCRLCIITKWYTGEIQINSNCSRLWTIQRIHPTNNNIFQHFHPFHSGLKPFGCETCGKFFRQKGKVCYGRPRTAEKCHIKTKCYRLSFREAYTRHVDMMKNLTHLYKKSCHENMWIIKWNFLDDKQAIWQ